MYLIPRYLRQVGSKATYYTNEWSRRCFYLNKHKSIYFSIMPVHWHLSFASLLFSRLLIIITSRDEPMKYKHVGHWKSAPILWVLVIIIVQDMNLCDMICDLLLFDMRLNIHLGKLVYAVRQRPYTVYFIF